MARAQRLARSSANATSDSVYLRPDSAATQVIDAVHPAAGDQRDQYDAAQLQRPSQPEMLLVLGAGDEHLVGHLGRSGCCVRCG